MITVPEVVFEASLHLNHSTHPKPPTNHQPREARSKRAAGVEANVYKYNSGVRKRGTFTVPEATDLGI